MMEACKENMFFLAYYSKQLWRKLCENILREVDSTTFDV